jgi:hypothetical protein
MTRLLATQHAYSLAREAYRVLQEAGAVHAAARQRSVLKSLQGAVRHAARLQHGPPPVRTITVHRRAGLSTIRGIAPICKLCQRNPAVKRCRRCRTPACATCIDQGLLKPPCTEAR